MKTNFLKTFTLTLIYSFLTAFPPPTVALTDQQIVQGLEVVGDFEAAYSLAYQLAEKQNTYTAWREVATKYAQFDSDGNVYLYTWQQAQRVNAEATYQDFLTLRPVAALNLHVIHAIFELVKASDKVADYVRFMERFPNTVEAIEALLRVQELAFARAKQANDPVIYDAFVTTFQGAKQIPEAIQLALTVERKAVAAEDQNVDYETHERIARQLYNEARLAEKEHTSLVAARRYALLNEERFRDTKVVTELLDREERLSFQKLMATKQTDIVNQIKGMQDAVVQTIQDQTQYLGNTIVKELQTQGQRLEEVITTQNRAMTQQLQAINQNLQVQGQQLQAINQTLQVQGQHLDEVIATHNRALAQQLQAINQNVDKVGRLQLVRGIDSPPLTGGEKLGIASDVVRCATASATAVATEGLAIGPALLNCGTMIAKIVGPLISMIKTWKFW